MTIGKLWLFGSLISLFLLSRLMGAYGGLVTFSYLLAYRGQLVVVNVLCFVLILVLLICVCIVVLEVTSRFDTFTLT